MIGFDARAAKLLAAGDHLIFPGAPGLRLVATETKKTWTYRYKSPVDGRMRQQRLGHWPAMSPASAVAAWELVRAGRAQGSDPAEAKRQQRTAAKLQAEAKRAEARQEAYTVRRACNEYLESYATAVAPKTYAEAKRLLDRELGAIEAKPAAEVTRADAFDLLSAMQDRPVVAAMLRQQLGAVWDRSLDSGRLPADTPNWWRLVLRGKLKSQGKVQAGAKQGQQIKRVLTDAEVAALLGQLWIFSRDVEDVLQLYLWTCCRGAEIVAMERAEISEEADGWWWTIPRAKLKMRRNPLTTDLRVPLVGRALEVVRRRLDATASGWVFPSVRPGGVPHLAQKAVQSAVWVRMPYSDTPGLRDYERTRLTVTHWAPHDLRRTGRTMLAALGCPAEVGEAILGHLPPGVQGVYNRHDYDVERRHWLTVLSQHLSGLQASKGGA